ncbi:MAG: hypothetical protein SWE60_13605, partial [Thermodesulfobacteriota bacterium]|nr:hypothetical protein [Thermodesulfobacteriota bacterium]
MKKRMYLPQPLKTCYPKNLMIMERNRLIVNLGMGLLFVCLTLWPTHGVSAGEILVPDDYATIGAA